MEDKNKTQKLPSEVYYLVLNGAKQYFKNKEDAEEMARKLYEDGTNPGGIYPENDPEEIQDLYDVGYLKDEEPTEVEKMPDDMREAYKTHAKKIANDSLESLIRNKDKAYVKYNDEIADIYKGELDERAKKPSEELDAYTKDLEDYLDKNPDAKKKNYY